MVLLTKIYDIPSEHKSHIHKFLTLSFTIRHSNRKIKSLDYIEEKDTYRFIVLCATHVHAYIQGYIDCHLDKYKIRERV